MSALDYFSLANRLANFVGIERFDHRGDFTRWSGMKNGLGHHVNETVFCFSQSIREQSFPTSAGFADIERLLLARHLKNSCNAPTAFVRGQVDAPWA